MKTTFKVGTRGSKLAVIQSKWVIGQLQEKYPEYKFEMCKIKTQGDIQKDMPLEIIGGKGVFVKDIQKALLDGTIDIAVHSIKDVMARLPEGLTIAAIPIRENPQDVIISASGLELNQLPEGSRVGTSSLRRGLLVKEIRPDLNILPIRGNVETRINKMKKGEYDAIVLAAAGLHRMGDEFKKQITHYLEADSFIPAVGQGALGIEVRKGSDAESLVKAIHHEETAYAVEAEREFLRRLNGNCKIPVAAHAYIDNGRIIINGTLAKDRNSKLYYGKKEGPVNDFQQIGTSLAEEIIEKAGIEIEEWIKMQEEGDI